MDWNIGIEAYFSDDTLFVSGSINAPSESDHPYLSAREPQSGPTVIDLELNFEPQQDPAATKGRRKLIPVTEIAQYTGKQKQVDIYYEDKCIATTTIRPERTASIYHGGSSPA